MAARVEVKWQFKGSQNMGTVSAASPQGWTVTQFFTALSWVVRFCPVPRYHWASGSTISPSLIFLELGLDPPA